MLSKYNDGKTIDCGGSFTFKEFVNEYGDKDTRILTVVLPNGDELQVFKANLVACLVGIAGCKMPPDYRKPNIHEAFISVIGTFSDCQNRGEQAEFSITASSETALKALHQNILKMCSSISCLLHRKTYLNVVGARLEIPTTDFTLPTDKTKIQIFKNGQLMIEGQANAYNVNGNGLDLLVPSITTDRWEIIIFS